MAWYDVTKEVKKISEVENVMEESIADEYELEHDDGIWLATNRRNQGSVLDRAGQIKEESRRKEVKLGFHWVKDEEGWAVTGNFSNEKVGDNIIVTRMNGTKSVQKIIRFSNIGNAYVE